MTVHINSYYRNLLSSFTLGADSYTNILLFRELNEAFPKLVREALALIAEKQISKVAMTSVHPTQPSFYIISSRTQTKDYIAMKGYCSCYDFHENVLVQETMFTCKHELSAIILEYMYSEPDEEEEELPCKEELEECDYLEKMYNTLNPGL